ncbi:hypothetical protein KFL_000050520 [Klebsormidium nitens]|uniref:Uncharacterized protein n=1 Tax=Klebsormidium nitens TaxID=105231 RepID=A0A1Y1HMT4_KLENI|nr:hypothetical protein KFL_000050520 [Klebsormidium nitens]|eukprot:GAQ77916.1 hypothetical protein KFL_000050520 [Klebsormidium nitens]
MAPNLAGILGGLFTKAGALAQSFAHYQKKMCDAALAEERFALLEVRSTMISCEKANGGIHSQPYQWLHEILLPPTDAVMHDYLHSPGRGEITEEARAPEPPGMFDDDPEVEGLFSEIVEAEPGFESSMRELDADIRAEYDWPFSFQDAVVRLGQIVLPLLEVGNPGSGTAGVDAVIGADVMQERRSGPGGALTPAESSVRVVQDRMP